MRDLEPARFRQLLGHFVTGVTIVTTVDESGSPVGMTANTLTSVSLDPPLISVCVDRAAEMHRSLEQSRKFAVNILSSSQEALSRRFAEQGTRRFEGVGFQRTESGAVILDGILAHLECERVESFPAGDHTVFLGRVVSGGTWEGEPLVYYRGGYTGLSR